MTYRGLTGAPLGGLSLYAIRAFATAKIKDNSGSRLPERMPSAKLTEVPGSRTRFDWTDGSGRATTWS
jgi:hypothetical protein